MATKLDEMEIDSVDLCKKGANQRAIIKLLKSVDDGEDHGSMGVIAKLADALQKALDGGNIEQQPITKAAGTEQVRATTDALRKSLESIISDDSMTPVEKHDMMAESLQQFTLEATDLMDGWAEAIWKAEDYTEGDPEYDPDEDPDQEEASYMEPGDDPEEENFEKGVFTMANFHVEKMSSEDRKALEALAKKYGAVEDPEQEIHPDVQKAIDEVAELRKSLEIKELESIAKKYEVIGKKAEDLAPKLYELKKAGEQHYNDFVALLDEQVQMAESGIFKEIGTSRGAANDLEATVSELMKADPTMTRAQAVCKAYEMNPGLDRFTGKMK